MKPYFPFPGSRPVRALWLAWLLLAPLALAQEPPASPASFLVYRPAGDTRDGLATSLAPPPFEHARLPVAWIDRRLLAEGAPEGRPESAPAQYREMLRLVQIAEAEGAPVRLAVDGSVAPGKLTLEVDASPGDGDPPANVTLSAVVFEHGVDVGGRAEPYVARFALAPEPIDLPGHIAFDVRLDPAWDLDRLGVVAIASADGRVLQSATWLPRQNGPTVQEAKAPLVETVTASWCAPCAPVDEAFLLLATQRGAAGPLASAGHDGYLRAPTGWLWAGLALGTLAAFALVRRRAP